MDILRKRDIDKYIRRLKNFDKKQQKRRQNLRIAEPKIFDLIIKELAPTKLLELHRVCNVCEEVCLKNGIYYESIAKCMYPQIAKGWDGDIICGYMDKKYTEYYIKKVLTVLADGHFFAMLQDCSFLNTVCRMKSIFRPLPFNVMYCHPLKVKVSHNGIFNDESGFSYRNHLYWFVWYKGLPATMPAIKWFSREVLDAVQHEYARKSIAITVNEEAKIREKRSNMYSKFGKI